MNNQQSTSGRLILISIINLIVLIITFTLVSSGTEGGNPLPDGATTNPALYPTIPVETAIPRLEVVIAIQNIPRGTVITFDRVTVVLYPVDAIPADAFPDTEDVVGKIAATDIFVNELILSRKLVDSLNSLGRTGSDLTTILQPGEVALTVYVPAENVVSGLQIGDRLDLIYTVPDGDSNTTFIISDVLLIWIGNLPDRFFTATSTPVATPTLEPNIRIVQGSPELYITSIPYISGADENGNLMLTIAVSRQDAVAIDWAINEDLPVRVIARSARTQGLPPIVPVNADNVLQLYSQPTYTPIPTIDFPATDMALLRNAHATATGLAEDMIALSTTSPENFATQSAISTEIHQQATIDPSNPMPKGFSAVQLTATALAELFSASPTATPTP